MLLLTWLLGLNLAELLTGFSAVREYFKNDHPDASHQGLWCKLHASASQVGEISYIRWYIDMLNPSIELRTCVKYWPERERRRDLGQQSKLRMDLSDFFWGLSQPWRWLRTIPIFLLRYCCAEEILYPRYQLWLVQRMGHKPLGYVIKWYPPLIITDIIRFCLVPAWVALAAVLLFCLILEDLFITIYRRAFHKRG